MSLGVCDGVKEVAVLATIRVQLQLPSHASQARLCHRVIDNTQTNAVCGFYIALLAPVHKPTPNNISKHCACTTQCARAKKPL
jgi:hypothetical protein